MPNANQKAKAGIIATRKLLAKERMAGFRATGSALDAIYGNLSTTQNGIGRSQTIANRKTMAALSRIAGKTDRATGRLVRGGEAQASRSYGSVVASAVDRQSGAVEAHRAAASDAIAGEVAAGRVGVQGATNVLAITKAGAKAAAAGAAGQLADALQYRAKNDAQIIAGMQEARMTANLQFQNWKKQQEWLSDQEKKDTKAQLGGVRQAADTASDAAVFFRQYMAENPGKTVPELVSAYHDKYGSLGGSEDPLLNILAGNVVRSTNDEGQTVNGYTWQDDAKDTMQALHTLYPSFGKVDVYRVIHASFRAYDAANGLKTLEDAINANESQARAAAEAEAEAKGLTGRSKTSYVVGHTQDAPEEPSMTAAGLSISGEPLMTQEQAAAAAAALGLTGRSASAYIVGHTTPA